jgi:hypothetical protein
MVNINPFRRSTPAPTPADVPPVATGPPAATAVSPPPGNISNFCCCIRKRSEKDEVQVTGSRRDSCFRRLLESPIGRVLLHLMLLLSSLIAYALFFAAWFWNSLTAFEYQDLDDVIQTRAIIFTVAIVLWLVTVALWIWLCAWDGKRRKAVPGETQQEMATMQQTQQLVRPTGSLQAHGADGAADWAANWSSTSSRIWAGGRMPSS